MRYRRSSTNSSRQQDGYALLLVVFFMALLVVSTMSIGLRVLTEGRREKEKEMIWRGKQYTRAIKLYYRKTGRFPTTVDNLVQPSLGNIRFLRQAYKDPMNKDDGSWRFIYVGPAGQLIGSLNPENNMPLGAQALGAQPGQTANSSASGFGSAFGVTGGSTSGIGLPGSTAGNQSTNGFSLFGSGTQASPTASSPAAGIGTATGATGTDTTNSAGTDPLQAALDSDPPEIVGGNIIGVGSKINHSSIMVYEKAQNYKLFEFIWNPAKDMAMISTGGAQIGAPAGTQGQGTSGQSGFGFGSSGQGGTGQGGFGFGQPGQNSAGQGGTGATGNPNAPQQPPTSDPNSNPNPNPQ
jgi:hypothetical protein